MTSATAPMTPEDIDRYREAVEALIASCLTRIREYRLRDAADPRPERSGP